MIKQVSVAMAVYNGEQYLKEQIDSILSQLSEADELVISYNESTDRTFELISMYEKLDSRVHVYICPEKGVISNFNNAIRYTHGDIIFLCDQDDIWAINKVEHVRQRFKDEKIILVEHNCEYIDAQGNPKPGDLFKRRNASTGYFKNTIKNCYQGSCMAFRRELLDYIYPIPTGIPMHDQWIGIIAEKYGKVEFLNEALIKYRRHDATVSDIDVGIVEKLKGIVSLSCNYLKRTARK